MARYTDEERSDAVVLLKAEGYPERIGALSAVSVALGIPDRTLQRWWNGESNPPPDKLVVYKKGELAAQMEKLLRKTLKRMDAVIPKEADLRSLTITAGVLTEKMQLLRDEPTDNVQIGALEEWKRKAEKQLEQVRELEDEIEEEAE